MEYITLAKSSKLSLKPYSQLQPIYFRLPFHTELLSLCWSSAHENRLLSILSLFCGQEANIASSGWSL